MNITLIGMPGSGKSVVGVLLAKRLNMGFVDGDLEIQRQEGCLLKDILKEKGFDGFEEIENRVNKNLTVENTVIAPGGSIIYCKEAMDHFKETGLIIYLRISLEELSRRLGDLKERGVALRDGMSLKDLYEERVPLYEQYADITVDEAGRDVGDVVDAIRNLLKNSEQFSKLF